MSTTEVQAGSVPAHRSTRFEGRPSYVVFLVAFLVAQLFSGQTYRLGLPVGPDRLLLAAALLLVVADRRVDFGRLRLGSWHACAAALCGLALLSGIAVGSIPGSMGTFALLDRLAVPLLLFVIGPLVFQRTEDRIFLLRSLTVIGAYLGATAWFETFGPTGLVFPSYILDPEVGIQFGRARGPFVASEANGLVMVASVLSSVCLLSRRHRSRTWHFIAGVTVLLAGTGVLLTLTRSVWLGLILAIVAVAVANRELRRAAGAGLVATLLLIPLALVVVEPLRDAVVDRATTSRSVDDRRNTNSAAVRAVVNEPLTGVGWSNFVEVSGDYVRQSPDYPVTNTEIEVHNVVLSRAAELGLVGALLTIGVLVLGPARAIVHGCARRRTSTDPDMLVLGLGFFVAWLVSAMLSPLPYPLPNGLMWITASLVAPWLLVRPSEGEATTAMSAVDGPASTRRTTRGRHRRTPR